MAQDETKNRILCAGNRTEVVLVAQGGREIVLKRLLSFADVAPERTALYREGLIQHCARGPGVLPIIDAQFAEVGGLNTAGVARGETRVIERAFVPGTSLKALISEGRPADLRPERCLFWMASLCATLHRIHHLRTASGAPLHLIHRDVTLGNVLISQAAFSEGLDEGHVWLNDFGLAHARAWGPLAPDETLQGAARFLAPELKAGAQPDGSSDVYQAGLLLAALLNAGEGEALSTLFGAGQQAPASDRARALLAPFGVQGTLEESPSARPTAAEFADELRRRG